MNKKPRRSELYRLYRAAVILWRRSGGNSMPSRRNSRFHQFGRNKKGTKRMFVLLVDKAGNRLAMVEVRRVTKCVLRNPLDTWVDEDGRLHDQFWTVGNIRLPWVPG